MKDITPPNNNSKSEKETLDIDGFIKLVTKKWPEAIKFFYHCMFGLDKNEVGNQY